jgi:hypothetical protein
MDIAMQIFRYIKGILVYSICFWHGEEGTLQGYIDVEWVGDCECQGFMFDYIFILCMSLISWSAKKQPSIATSSTKMECQVMIEASKKKSCDRDICCSKTHIQSS